MSDSYKTDVERIQRLVVSIRSDINKRDQKKNAGQAVAMIEGEIRGQLTNLERELDLFNQLIVNQERNQSQNNIMQRELEKRRNQYTDYINQKNQLRDTFDKSIQANKDELMKQATKPQQGRVKDDPQMQAMTKKDLYSNQKDLEKEQDQQLDRVNEKLTNIKYTGQAMNENIKQQNRMLDQVNNDVDQTTKELMRTNSKLKKFIATSSNWCLLLVIVLEIVSLILFIIYLP